MEQLREQIDQVLARSLITEARPADRASYDFSVEQGLFDGSYEDKCEDCIYEEEEE